MKNWVVLFLFFIMATAGVFSHISASEFWPLSLSREFWNFGTPEMSVYYKPSFHILLSFLYFLPLDNWEHILSARLIFSLLGGCNFLLFLNWVTRSFSIKKNPQGTALVGVLFLSPLFLLQVVKIRSDMWALFLALVLLNLTAERAAWSSRRFLLIFFVHGALLTSTPRAISHSLIVVVFAALSLRLSGEGRHLRRPFYFVLLAPLACALIVGLFATRTLLPLRLYLQASYQESFWQWDIVWETLKSDVLTVILIVSGFFLTTETKARCIFALAAGLYFSADLKTPYLWASYYPFFILPLAIFLLRISNDLPKRRLSFLALSLLAIGLMNFSWQIWKQGPVSSNLPQKEVVQKLSQFLQAHPSYLFFDGLGVLPRSKQLLSYIGPNDSVTLDGIQARWQFHPPDVILVTSRTFLLGDRFTERLNQDYQVIGPNIFLAKNLPQPEKLIELSQIPYLIFGL